MNSSNNQTNRNIGNAPGFLVVSKDVLINLPVCQKEVLAIFAPQSSRLT